MGIGGYRPHRGTSREWRLLALSVLFYVHLCACCKAVSAGWRNPTDGDVDNSSCQIAAFDQNIKAMPFVIE